jgi:hypothetical protein
VLREGTIYCHMWFTVTEPYSVMFFCALTTSVVASYVIPEQDQFIVDVYWNSDNFANLWRSNVEDHTLQADHSWLKEEKKTLKSSSYWNSNFFANPWRSNVEYHTLQADHSWLEEKRKKNPYNLPPTGPLLAGFLHVAHIISDPHFSFFGLQPKLLF